MGFFGTILAPVENLLQFVLESLHSLTDLAGVGSYGLAIILLTVITLTQTRTRLNKYALLTTKSPHTTQN